METFATSHAAPWMGFLLVRSVYLWDPAIDGASQTGLPKPLLAAAAFTSALELQPGLPSQLLLLSFTSRRQAQAGHLHQLLGFNKAAQAEACFSSSSVLLLYPSRGRIKCWQLSSALNLLLKVTSVLYPEGMEEQMQPVKSGFNSPASFNFLPCLLINESALAALGIQRFFHIQENSTQWLCWLSCQGLEQAVSHLL